MLIKEDQKDKIVDLYKNINQNLSVNLKNIIEVHYFHQKYKKYELFISLFKKN